MDVNQQSKDLFAIEELEPRVLLSGDIAGAVSTALTLASSPLSTGLHSNETAGSLTPSDSAKASNASQYDPAAELASMFSDEAPSLTIAPPPAPSSAPATPTESGTTPAGEQPATETSNETAAQQSTASQPASSSVPSSESSSSAAGTVNPDISGISDQLVETLRAAQGPPSYLTLSSADNSSYFTASPSNQGSESTSSLSLSSLPPPGTNLTKVSALRSGLTALVGAIATVEGTAPFTTPKFPLLVNKSFGNLITDSGLQTELKTGFFDVLDAYLRDTAGPTVEGFGAYIATLSQVLPGTVETHLVGNKASYDLHLRLTKTTTATLSQQATFPDQGVNQTVGGTAPVSVTVDLELTFGVDMTPAVTDPNAFTFGITRLDFGVATDGIALVSITGAGPSDPKGTLAIDTALQVQFHPPSGTAPFASLADLQGASASTLLQAQNPTGKVSADLPLPNALTLGGSILAFTGTKSVGVRAPVAFTDAPEVSLALEGQIKIADFVVLIGSVTLRKMAPGTPAPASLPASITKVPLTGVKLFLGTGWGTANARGVLLSAGEGGMILTGTGIALDVEGTASTIGLEDVVVRGNLHARINTTGTDLDVEIPALEPLQNLITLPPAARITFTTSANIVQFEGSLRMNIEKTVVLNGDFFFKAVTEATTFRLDVAAKDVELFLGTGEGTEAATGFRVNEGTVGLLIRRPASGRSTIALDASGRVSLVGIENVYFNGSAHVRYNTMGLVNENINIPGTTPVAVQFIPLAQQGTPVHPYVCVAGTMLLSVNYVGLVQIGGDIAVERTFTESTATTTTNSIEAATLQNVVFSTGSSVIASGDALYNGLRQDILDQANRLTADGFEVLGITATVNGSISQIGLKYKNRDNATHLDNLDANRRDHVVALAGSLTTDLTAALGHSFGVTFTTGGVGEGGWDKASQNANFSSVVFQVRKSQHLPSVITYRVAATDVMAFVGDGQVLATRTVSGGTNIELPADAKGLKISHGSLALLLEIAVADPATSTPQSDRFALDARGAAALIGFPEVTLSSAARVRINTLGKQPSSSAWRLFTDPFTLCGVAGDVTVDPDVDQGGDKANPFVRVDADVKINFFDYFQAKGTVSFSKITQNDDSTADIKSIDHFTESSVNQEIKLPVVYFATGYSGIIDHLDTVHVTPTNTSAADVAAFARYQVLLSQIRAEIARVEAANPGYKVTTIHATVDGHNSAIGGIYANRDAESGVDELAANRRDHVLALAPALTRDLGVTVELEQGVANQEGPTVLNQNAKFTGVNFTIKKAGPGKTEIMIAGTGITGWIGYVVGFFDTATTKYGLELKNGQFGLLLITDPKAATTDPKKFALHAEGEVNLVLNTTALKLLAGGKYIVDINTIKEGVDRTLDVQDPITGAKLATVKLFYVEELQRVCVDGTLGINGLTLNGRFLMERFHPEDSASPLDFRTKGGAHLARIYFDGTPALFPAFSGFDISGAGVQEWVVELKRIADWLTAVRGSSFFKVKIPFTNTTLGEAFDVTNNYLQDFYSRIVFNELEGQGALSSDVSTKGLLTSDVTFYLTVNGAASPTKVVLHASDTTDNQTVSAGQTPMGKLADDLNAALTAAFAATEFAGLIRAYVKETQVEDLDGNLVPKRTLVIGNVPGKTVDRIRLTGFGVSDDSYKKLGFVNQQESAESPQPDSEEALLNYIRNNVPGSSPLHPADLIGLADAVAAAQGTDLHFTWTKALSANFGSDLSFFGGFANLAASGTISIAVSIDFSTTLGVDFTPVETPRLRNAVLVPPPSNGKITDNAAFTVILNTSRTSALGTGDRYDVTLAKVATNDNNSVQSLADDLNAAFALAGKTGDSSNKLSQHVEARVVGNALVLVVKDTELGVINSLEVQASSQNVAVTEIGLPTNSQARSKVKGLFFEGLSITGSVTITAGSLHFSAKLGGTDGIIAFSAGPGTLTGTLGVTVSLVDPTVSSGLPRIYISSLVADLERVSSFIQPHLNTTAAVSLTLLNMSVTTPGFGNLIDPDENTFSVLIPDVTDLHINSQPYNATTNNKGVFIQLPEFSSFTHFNCLTVVDLLGGLGKLGHQLENVQGFEFIKDPLPGVGVSLGEILDVGSKLLDAVSGILHGDAATLERLQHDLEDLLGLPSGSLLFTVDHVANPKLDSTHTSVLFDPQGGNNGIRFNAVIGSGTYDPVHIKFSDDGRYAAGLDLAEATYDEARRVVTIQYNATYTKASTVVAAVQRLINDEGSRGPPITVSVDSSTGGDGSGSVSQTAIRVELSYTAAYAQNLPFYFRFKDYVDRLPDATFGAAKALLGALADLVSIEASGNVSISASVTFRLSLGLDISNPCRPMPFLYDSGYAGPNTGTGIFLNAAVRGTNLDFKAGGLLGIRVRNGTITFDGDGDPTTRGPNDNASISLTLKDVNGTGRHYFFRDTLFDLSNFDLSLHAGFSVVLPVYGLSLIPLGSTADNNGDGFADNSLAMLVPDLSHLLSGNTTGIKFAAPDVASLFRNLDVCAIIRSTPVLLDGLDELLGKIEDGLRSQVLNQNLPLIGDKLSTAANFISDFRTGLLGNLRAKLAEAGDPLGLVKEAIFAALGPSGLDLLVKVDAEGQLLDSDGHVITPDDGLYLTKVVRITDFNDIQVNCANGNIDFKIRLLKSANLVDTSANPIQFNIGIPGFGLSVDGNVLVSVGFDLKLYFGVNLNQGFYFQTDYRPASSPTSIPSDELRVFFSVSIPGLHAKGQLFFLQLDVSDESDGVDAVGAPRLSSVFAGYFIVDIKDPIGNDGKLTVSDLQRPGLSLGDVVSAQLGAKAEVHLDLAISFGGSTQFPRLLAEFDLSWKWELGKAVTAPSIGINHVQLDVGSFVSDLLAPILQEVKKVTGPLQPVVDAITAPIPVLSDLAGRPFNMLDLAELFGYLTPSSRKFVEAIATIITLANNTPISAGGAILIPLGSISITQDNRGKVQNAPKGGTGPTSSAPSENIPSGGSSGPFKAFFDSMEKIGFKFPIISISAVADLFAGKPVSIVEYHMPVLELKASFSKSINVFGPLAVFFGGQIGIKIDLTFGYDTYGLQKFFASSDKDALVIFDGFFIKDVNDKGEDVPEIVFSGGLFAGAGLSVGFAEAGVKGGIYAEIDFNLNDPDGDGRVRVSEIIANAKKDIRCIFDITGEVYAEFSLFLDIHLFIVDLHFQWDFARITILKFEIVCPMPYLAHFTDRPTSGKETFDGRGGAGVLVLNMGPEAHTRGVDNTTDGDEVFVVKHVDGDPTTGDGETVEVTFGGIKQTFYGVKTIVADGGSGNDTIDLRDLLARSAGVVGGSGNDIIYASKGAGTYQGGDGDDVITAPDGMTITFDFYGNAGNDHLTGGGGADNLFGEDGDDEIIGLVGDDHLVGGKGNDRLRGEEGNDDIEGNEGRDHAEGGDGDDLIRGGDGDDDILGGLGSDRLVGNAGGDVIDGGEGDDILVGDDGTIAPGFTPIHVTNIDGAGDDILIGAGGADAIFGCGGNDWIFGGARIGAGSLTPVALDGADFIDAGDGNDHVFADDAGGAGTESFPGSTVAGLVWFDVTRNSFRDSNENGIANVLIELHNSVDDSLIGTTRTNSAGAYQFQGLRAGSYYVLFTAPPVTNLDGTPSSATLQLVDPNQGTDDDLDSEAVVATGKTAAFTLTEGQSSVHQDAGFKSDTLQVNIDNPSVREGNSGFTSLIFTVSLSQAVSEQVLFCYKTVDGTAKDVVDYLGADWTLVFKPGETSKTITIQVKGDTIDEGQSETMFIQVCDVVRGIGRDGITLTRTQATGTIIDDDAPPVVSIGDGVQQGPAETDKVRFFVTLSNPSASIIKVDWRTGEVVGSDGALLSNSATEGADYVAGSGQLVFLPGEVSKFIDVQPNGDALDEYDEQFAVAIELPYATPASLATTGDQVGTGHIADDDATPYLRITPASTSVTEGQAGLVPVKLKIGLYDPLTNSLKASGRYVNANWSTSNGTALVLATGTEVADAEYAFGTVRFAPGELEKEITVYVIGDQVTEANEYFYVNLLTSENAIIDPTDLTANHATINILNDETPDAGPWYVQFGQSHYQVDEGGYIEVTIDRAPGSSEPDAVLWISFSNATKGAGPGPGIDYQGDFTLGGPQQRLLVSFADGENQKVLHIQTFTDNAYEGDERVVFRLANPTGGPVRGAIAEATLVIKDLQPAPIIRVYDAGVDETGAFALLRVTAELPDDVTLGSGLLSTVRWHTKDGTAKAALPDQDYFAADHPGVDGDPDAVVFKTADFGGPDANTLPQVATKFIKVAIRNDVVAEPDETFFVDLSEAANATIDRAEGTVTIRDNDVVPVSGYVYQDLNHNGRYDSDVDSRLPGVQVQVTDAHGTITTTTTNSSGLWSANAVTGDLIVEVKSIETVLVGAECSTGNNPLHTHVDYLALTTEDIGFAVEAKETTVPGSTGSALVYNDDTVYGGPGNDEIDGGGGDDWLVGGHWLGPGCACSGNPYDATVARLTGSGGRITRTYIDPASLASLGTLTGHVWLDFRTPAGLVTNGNGLADSGEAGVAGVQVNLFDENWVLVGTQYTDANGDYRFENLAACHYVAQFVLPDGSRFTTATVSPADRNNDADPLTGLTSSFVVSGGATTAHIDAGLMPVNLTGAGPWNVSFGAAIFSVRQSDPQALIRILHSLGTQDGDADFFTRNGTAIAGVDYDALKTVLSFADDQAQTSLSITIHNSGPKGAPRTVLLFLVNPTGGPVKGAIPKAVLLIFDDGCPDNDTISGREGNDLILGDYGFFRVNPDGSKTVVELGGMGNDTLFGDSGNDEIRGEGGNDRLDGGRGDDILNGGSENDTYVFNGDRDGSSNTAGSKDHDSIVEGAAPLGGVDLIDLSVTSSYSVVIDLNLSTEQAVTPALNITLPSGGLVEGVIGGRLNDTLLGTDNNDYIDGGAGDDLIEGRRGNDVLIGGTGSDTYRFDADVNLGTDEIRENATPATAADHDLIDLSLTTTVGANLNLGLTVQQAVSVNLRLTLSDAQGIENVYGTSQGDTLTGNARDNIVWGREGNDVLDGGSSGYDVLKEERPGNWQLGGGVLTLVGTGETDTFLSGSFDEISLTGDDSANVLDASSFAGLVRLDGRGGNDTLKGGSGINYLTGGRGSDVIVGGTGVNILTEQGDGDFVLTPGSLVFTDAVSLAVETDTFSDIDQISLTGGDHGNLLDASGYTSGVSLDGGAGNDRILGSSGDDLITGGAGDDELVGGAGNDRYVFNAEIATGHDTVTEGAGGGEDVLDFSGTATVGISIDLSRTTAQLLNTRGDSSILFIGLFVEDVIGTEQGDEIIGNGLVNHLEGRGGNDVLRGNGGNDLLDGGAGTDRVSEATDGNATLVSTAVPAGSATLTFSGAVGADGHAAGEIDTLLGIESATLTGGATDNILDTTGFTGSVILNGGAGNDTLSSGAGNDVLNGGLGDDVMSGGDGSDRYVINADTDFGHDQLFEDPHYIVVSGNPFNTSLDTLDFSDTLTVGVTVDLRTNAVQTVAPNVTIWLRANFALTPVPNFDIVLGGEANDVLIGNDLPNLLSGGNGNDRIVDGGALNAPSLEYWVGGNGDDTYEFHNATASHLILLIEDVGSGGTDTLDFSAYGASVNLDLSNGKFQTVDSAGNVQLELLGCHTVENFIGGVFGDTVHGNGTDNSFRGGGGNDRFDGARGNDQIEETTSGNAVLVSLPSPAGAGRLTFSGAVGPDGHAVGEIDSFQNVERAKLSGTAANNILDATGYTGSATLIGGAGNDTLRGGKGDDVLEGGTGNDLLAGGAGNDRYVYQGNGNLGTDHIAEADAAGNDTVDLTAFKVTAPSLDPGAAGVPQTVGLLTNIIFDTASTVELVTYPPPPAAPPAPAGLADAVSLPASPANFREPYVSNASLLPPPVVTAPTLSLAPASAWSVRPSESLGLKLEELALAQPSRSITSLSEAALSLSLSGTEMPRS